MTTQPEYEYHQVALSDGANLNVKLTGLQNKDKPLVIALHGGPGVSNHLESGYDFLAERYRLILYDARGSGKSDVKGPFSHARWVADLDELRAWAGVDTFILAGASYGGFVALEYILQHPHRVAALIVKSTWACGPLGALTALKNMITSKRAKVDPDMLVRSWSGTLRDHDDFAACLSACAIYYKAFVDGTEKPPVISTESLNLEVINTALSVEQPRFDVRSRLGEIQVPALVVGGRQDIVTTVDQVEVIAQGIRDSRLVILEKSGHNLHDDEPELWQEAVHRFLDEKRF